MPQIIRKSNFGYEDHRGDERLVAIVGDPWEARIMCDALNKRQGPHVLRAPTVAGALRLHRLTLAIQVARRAYEDAKRGTALFS